MGYHGYLDCHHDDLQDRVPHLSMLLGYHGYLDSRLDNLQVVPHISMLQ